MMLIYPLVSSLWFFQSMNIIIVIVMVIINLLLPHVITVDIFWSYHTLIFSFTIILDHHHFWSSSFLIIIIIILDHHHHHPWSSSLIIIIIILKWSSTTTLCYSTFIYFGTQWDHLKLWVLKNQNALQK